MDNNIQLSKNIIMSQEGILIRNMKLFKKIVILKMRIHKLLALIEIK